MREPRYPLLARRRRRRRWRIDARRYARPLAILMLAAALIGAIALAQRPRVQVAAELLALARQTYTAGNYSAARRNAQRAGVAMPALGAAHLMLARADLKLGDGLSAEAALDRAVTTGIKAATLHSLRAEALLEQGDLAGALAEPTGGDRIRALTLAAQGHHAQAQAMLAALVARAPGDGEAWEALGRLRLDAGETGGASLAAGQATRLRPRDPVVLTLMGEVVRQRYGLVAALPWFDAALKHDAFYHPALIERAATLGEVGRYEDALAATRAALLARPGSPQALYLQAVIAARAGQLDLSRRLLARTNGVVDNLPGALLLHGALDQAAGRREEAAARWRRLLAMQPMNLTARRLLAGVDADGALALIRPLALRRDADSYALTLAARAWARAGEAGPAAALLDRAGAGGAADGVFASDDGVGVLVADARGNPGDPTYAVGVIRALMSGGNRTGALATARALAGAAPGDPAAQLVLGDILAAVGDWRAAAPVYRRAANLRFDAPTAFRLIDALGRAGRARDAATVLALYLAQNPQSLAGQRLLGHWQVAAGQWDAAIETLEGARRRLGDRDAGLLADLALAYAGANEGDVARSYGAAAYRLAPLRAPICDAYGVALAAAGDADGARQLLAKAAALAPGDPVIAAHRRPLA